MWPKNNWKRIPHLMPQHNIARKVSTNLVTLLIAKKKEMMVMIFCRELESKNYIKCQKKVVKHKTDRPKITSFSAKRVNNPKLL